jgi:molybdopterin converting factor small subunit
MAQVKFTPALTRHIDCPPQSAEGASVREVLDIVFAGNPRARNYVLDDQLALRKHIAVFVNGRRIKDLVHLSDAVAPNDEIYVLQALSGG